MLSFFDKFRDINMASVLIRFGMAFLLGGAIGLERSFKNRSAGFRTHILVTAAACVASMTGIYLYLNLHLPSDISRIGSQIVSGLGFIGAGTIIVTKKPKVKGLTTAAGLWASGIVGIAVGAGFYEGAIVATFVVLLAQILFSYAEQYIRTTPEFEITLKYQDRGALDETMRYCKDHWLAIMNLRVTGDSSGDKSEYTAFITLLPKLRIDEARLFDHIREIPGISEINKLDI